ncbi:MAG TPA: ribonuclease H-like domain-containing protein [Terriglobia bacterium]|nr:ribonuclease H-like domain-containing protein [Terriglobia bacterium]
MPRKFLAFDIETAKDVPGADFNWKPHRPLGICCAAALRCDAREANLWYGKKADGTPAKQISRAEATEVVLELARLVAEGYTLLTWNGLGFDLDILAEESASPGECKDLALNHVDAMFHVFCQLGYPVGLEKAAQALRIPGKPPGMSGVLAPQLWEQGRRQEVLQYVAQDVRIALQVAQKSEERRRFEWITRKGTVGSMNLPRGWLSVCEALKLPLPDSSWMTRPIPRNEFTKWISI